jgi:peptide/nickel transport system permease protein
MAATDLLSSVTIERRGEPLGAAALVSIGLLAGYLLLALFAPLLVGDYVTIDTTQRLKPPSALHWFGTDHLGHDIFARTLAGTRASLIVGASVAAVTALVGTLLGLVAGYLPRSGQIIMRVMDGLMAIPAVLLAIALASLLGSGLATLIVAITVPEVPRMARLARGVVLSFKERLFVTAAVSLGSSTTGILGRHILPNAAGALVVQTTYVCAAAIIMESVLSFLGVGVPSEVPSWGNIMAIGRQYFIIAPWIIAAPGLFLSVLVLSINLLADALLRRLDPHLIRKGRR